MAKYEMLIQLIVDGRAAWQVRELVPKEYCRKMTDPELKAVANTLVNELGAIVKDRGASKTPAPAAVPAMPEPTIRPGGVRVYSDGKKKK